MGKIYQVVVHGFKGERLLINICNTEEQFKSMTVLQLRGKIVEKFPECKDASDLRLIFAVRILDEDSALLSDYGIQNLSHIHMVVKAAGGGTLVDPELPGLGDKDGNNRSMEQLFFNF